MCDGLFLNNICSSLHEFKWNFVHCRAYCFLKTGSGGSKIAAAVKRDKSEVVVFKLQQHCDTWWSQVWEGGSGCNNFEIMFSRFNRFKCIAGCSRDFSAIFQSSTGSYWWSWKPGWQRKKQEACAGLGIVSFYTNLYQSIFRFNFSLRTCFHQQNIAKQI